MRACTPHLWFLPGAAGDPISPPAVGRFLQHALPRAELVVIPNGKHDVAHAHAAQAAHLIRHFLGKLHVGDAQEKSA